MPNSSMLVLAKRTAPAAASREVTVDATGEENPRSAREPAVVGAPGRQKLSLTAMGAPSRVERGAPAR